MNFNRLTIIFLGLSCLNIAYAKTPRLAKAESVGMSSERLQKVDQLASQYIVDKKYSGIVTLVARKGKIVHLNAQGTLGVDNQTPMKTDTLFRIYSMTKPITTIAAMMLYEQGKFHMNDPVSKYLPEFADQKVWVDGELNTPKSPMLMRQLFMHSAGLSYGFNVQDPVDVLYQKANLFNAPNLQVFTDELAKLPLRYEPGERYHYSVGLDVVGAVIEKLSGMPLDVFFKERIFEPLKMQDTFFELPADKQSRLADDQTWDASNNVIATVPPERSLDFTKVSLFTGGGGLISTAHDYFRFSQMVLNGGQLDGARLLSPKTIEYLSLPHMTPQVRSVGVHNLHGGQTMALGYGVVTNPELMPAISSKGELSWAGLAGTKFWIDPEEQLIAIALVQLYNAPWPLRYDLKAVTYQAIEE